MEIQAYAGPMNLEQAQVFRKRWKTPPRVTAATSPTKPTSPVASPRPMNSPLRRFTAGGAGARRLFTDAKDSPQQQQPQPQQPFFGTPFKQYRDSTVQRLRDNFEDSPLNRSSVADSSPFDSPMYAERHAKLSDTEKGLELIGRELAKEQNIKWREHWSFLGEFVDIGSSDGLAKLEQHLLSREKPPIDVSAAAQNVSAAPAATAAAVVRTESSKTLVNSVCDALAKLAVKDHRSSNGDGIVVNATITPTNAPPAAASIRRTAELSPPSSAAASPFSVYLCAEKSWQVYAKRISNTIILHVDSVSLVCDTLKAELKRLKALICSYKEDCRFWKVDFQAAHSRFAHLIVYYITHECDTRQVDKVTSCLLTIQKSTVRQLVGGGTESTVCDSITAGIHLQCLLNCLLGYLNNIGEFDALKKYYFIQIIIIRLG